MKQRGRPHYDENNLTPEQWEALCAFAGPMAAALKAGVTPVAIEKHVKGILERVRAHGAL